MATIGEILANIRSGKINPAPSGDSPYGGVNPGTNAPIAKPGIDDIPDNVKSQLSDYLSQRTLGLGATEEKNTYPLGPDLQEVRLTDPNSGNPSPLTNIADSQKAFAGPTPSTPGESDIQTAFQALQNLGFFEDLQGDDGPNLDKNNQISGNTILNSSEVKEKISGVLATNRFSAMNNPDVPFAAAVDTVEYDFVDQDGVRKDHPQIEKIKNIASFVMNTGKRAKEAFPDAKFIPALNPDSAGIPVFGKSSNLDYGEINENTGLNPNTGQPDSSTGAAQTPQDNNRTQLDGMSSIGISNSPDFPYGAESTPLQRKLLEVALDEIEVVLAPAFELLNGLFGLFSYNGIFANNPFSPTSLPIGNRFGFKKYPLPTGIDASTGEIILPNLDNTSDAGYKFIRAIGLPIPKFVLTRTGNPSEIVTNMVKLGLQNIKITLAADSSSARYYSGVIRKAKRVFSAENNFGLPTIPNTDIWLLPTDQEFIQSFKDCEAMKFIRAMATLAESFAVGSSAAGSNPIPQPYAFSGYGNLNKLKNSASNRHLSGRVGINQISSLSIRNQPSLMLLPRAFQDGKKRSNNPVNPTSALKPNTDTNISFKNILQAGTLLTIPPGGSGSGKALLTKMGTPLNETKSRFSREEVEAIENTLEAEHLPFYFHDLRTNEIISFHAFLNTLSDSFSPSFNASSGFGRIEDVQIYQKTTRSISIDFSLVSINKEDMQEMYWKLNKLIAMVYPQFSRGTMLEHSGQEGVTRFVQPFSQVTTATPLIRLRVGDLIKSNYSREAVSRLMGVSDENFQVLGPNEPIPTEGFTSSMAVQGIMSLVSEKPLNPDGTYNDEKGWPKGSKVIVDPSYSPLVAFNPQNATVDSDLSATIIEGNIGVEIVDYHTFSNPLGGSNPNTEEIVIEVKVSGPQPAPGWPTSTYVATRNATGEKLGDDETVMLSYNDINHAASAQAFCHGVNADLFPQFEIVESGFEESQAPTDSATQSMFKRLFKDENPIMKSFETTAGRGLAGVITSLNFDWGLNSEGTWDVNTFGYRAPKMCKISIAFTPIHDITPGLDADGMIRAPVFNVAGASPHQDEDVHPNGGLDKRSKAFNDAMEQRNKFDG
jgi:hypothetical protein